MSKKSQKVHVERLAAALERKGVSLKRHELIEITAQAFGFADSNPLSAAAKRGDLDLTEAIDIENVTVSDPVIGRTPLTCLHDPIAQKPFGIYLEDLQEKGDRIIATPYGNIIAIPASNERLPKKLTASHFKKNPSDFETIRREGKSYAIELEWIGEGIDGDYNPSNPNDIPLLRVNVQRRTNDGDWEDLNDGSYCTQFSATSNSENANAIATYLLYKVEQEISAHPKRFLESLSSVSFDEVEEYFRLKNLPTTLVLSKYRNMHFSIYGADDIILSSREISIIGEQKFLTFLSTNEYNPKTGCENLRARIRNFQNERSEQIERINGYLKVETHKDSHCIEIALHIPLEVADKFSNAYDLETGLTALLGNPNFDAPKAIFHPQAWFRDNAVDVDPEGPTEFDITFDLLRLGEDARDLQDNSDGTDIFQRAASAPDWIYYWDGPYYIQLEESAFTFLNEHQSGAITESITKDFSRDMLKTYDEQSDLISFIATIEDHETLSEELDDIADEIKGALSAKGANMAHEDCAEDTINGIESWVTGNVSNSTWRSRIAAAIAFCGTKQAIERLAPQYHETAPKPETGTSASMPSGDTSVMVESVVAELTGGAWMIQDQYGDLHTISFNGSSWIVEIPA